MTSVYKTFLATRTMRWHTHPILCDSGDSVASHMGRVAALVCHFFPDDLVAIKAAVLHDMGEAAVGDMSHKVKKKYPELREMLHQAEAEALADLNIVFPELTEEQAKRVYFCDQLDALMWAYLKHPWLSEVELWQVFENWVAGLGKELGVEYDLSKCAY